MKIASLEARSYRYPLGPPFPAAWDPKPRHGLSETIVSLGTDEGISGHCGGASVPELEALRSLLMGLEVTDTDRLFSICETVDFHGGRNWTVEVAVWDALARRANQPLWRFLGGTRDRYPAYQSTGERVGIEERVERLQVAQSLGIGAAKLRFDSVEWRNDLAGIEKIQSALGGAMRLMADANQGWRMPGDTTPRWDLATAKECLSICDELGVFWLEEPLDPGQLEDYRTLTSASSSVLIAAGEMVRSLSETHLLMEVVDVIQTDVVLAGGVTGCRRVADWAEELSIPWSPHTWTTGYGLVANLHVALAFSTAPYLEYPFDPPAWTTQRRDFMLPNPISLDGEGNVVAPDGPGLGVEPDFDFLEQWRVG
ncbi:MAG: mandelate racemase/muconate lactonizing enzyme family protein [Acidimicrobiia bacterium]